MADDRATEIADHQQGRSIAAAPLATFADWPALRAATELLLRGRQRSDAAAVAAGKLTPAAADARDRVARALVAIWRAVETQADVPDDLPAGDAEIRADLATAVAAIRRMAAARPGNAAIAEQAERLAAIAYHHREYRPGGYTAAIMFLHRCNQAARAMRPARPAAAPADRGAPPARTATTTPQQQALFA